MPTLPYLHSFFSVKGASCGGWSRWTIYSHLGLDLADCKLLELRRRDASVVKPLLRPLEGEDTRLQERSPVVDRLGFHPSLQRQLAGMPSPVGWDGIPARVAMP